MLFIEYVGITFSNVHNAVIGNYFHLHCFESLEAFLLADNSSLTSIFRKMNMCDNCYMKVFDCTVSS